MDANGNLAAVELFAGAGGLLLGTSLAGFRHLAAAEWEHNCCDTLRLNQAKGYPLIDEDMRIIEGDVRDVDWSFLPRDIDLLAGGLPCQPFSLGGRIPVIPAPSLTSPARPSRRVCTAFRVGRT